MTSLPPPSSSPHHRESPMDDSPLEISDILPEDTKAYDKMRPPSSGGEGGGGGWRG